MIQRVQSQERITVLGKSLKVILIIPYEEFSDLLKQFAFFVQSVCKETYSELPSHSELAYSTPATRMTRGFHKKVKTAVNKKRLGDKKVV
jgi:hypothetical protein